LEFSLFNLYDYLIRIKYQQLTANLREAEISAVAKSRMDFYFSSRHFPRVEIRLKKKIQIWYSKNDIF